MRRRREAKRRTLFGLRNVRGSMRARNFGLGANTARIDILWRGQRAAVLTAALNPLTFCCCGRAFNSNRRS
jgi:hypothetical protein